MSEADEKKPNEPIVMPEGEVQTETVKMSESEIAALNQRIRDTRVHRKTFMGGRKTAVEVHRELVFKGRKCTGCGTKKVALRIKMFAPLTDLQTREYGFVFLMQLAHQHEGRLPVIDTIYGKFVRVSDIFACDNCKKTAEVAAAKHPDSWICEIDRGPAEDKPTVAVPDSLRH